ncbi:MAG TPA: hypothetical protein VEC36_06980 [Patescibacteria group bacterium]|nr:hypothetical protein [Patescibacteria group bacterium]
MQKLCISSLLAVCFLVSSCSELVVRLKPVAQQTFWSKGREIVSKPEKDIAVQVVSEKLSC